MAKVRVLYVIGSSEMGGAGNFVYTLLQAINNDKFEKYVVCPAGGYYTEKFRSSTKDALFINPQRSFMNLGTILRVARFIKNNHIDIVHTMLYGSDFCGIVASRVSGKSVVLNTIAGHNFSVFEKGRLRLKRRLASLIYRFIYYYSDKLVAVSESVRQDLINRRGIKLPAQKIETVLGAGTNAPYHNFSEEDVNYLRVRYLKGNEIVIAAIGMLTYEKDYSNMLKGFSLIANKNSRIKLLIAGDGPEKNRLQKEILDFGLGGRVYLLGALEERKRNALLDLTDIFIMSSRVEGCPTALLEAMYFGKALIATEAGGIPEIIKHGESGLLVPIGKPEQLAEAILNLAENEERRMELGKRAKQIFDQRFTQSHMLETYERIYHNLLVKYGKILR